MNPITTWPAGQDPAGLRRWLQIGLGALWVLDAALQYQPYMFSRRFVTTIIDPASSGNPAVIANPVTAAGHIMLHAPAAFNTAFATIQLAIGLGLLWRPTARAALAGTIAWGTAVWLLGEGLGGILTGTASPLTGAPGAAVLYVLLAILIWPPRAPGKHPAAPGHIAAARPAASVAAASRLGPRWARLAWLALWASSAYFLLQPPVRTRGNLSSAITGMAAGEPSWLASTDQNLAHAIGSGGSVISAVLAITFLLIGLAIYTPATTRPALVLAALTAAAIWILTENLGGILTGTGTDPDTGPLLILLAAAYWPRPPRQRETPATVPASGAGHSHRRNSENLTGRTPPWAMDRR